MSPRTRAVLRGMASATVVVILGSALSRVSYLDDLDDATPPDLIERLERENLDLKTRNAQLNEELAESYRTLVEAAEYQMGIDSAVQRILDSAATREKILRRALQECRRAAETTE